MELAIRQGVCGSSIDPSAHGGFTSTTCVDATKPLGGNPEISDKVTSD